jgi:hypothetical protein
MPGVHERLAGPSVPAACRIASSRCAERFCPLGRRCCPLGKEGWGARGLRWAGPSGRGRTPSRCPRPLRRRRPGTPRGTIRRCSRWRRVLVGLGSEEGRLAAVCGTSANLKMDLTMVAMSLLNSSYSRWNAQTCTLGPGPAASARRCRCRCWSRYRGRCRCRCCQSWCGCRGAFRGGRVPWRSRGAPLARGAAHGRPRWSQRRLRARRSRGPRPTDRSAPLESVTVAWRAGTRRRMCEGEGGGRSGPRGTYLARGQCRRPRRRAWARGTCGALTSGGRPSAVPGLSRCLGAPTPATRPLSRRCAARWPEPPLPRDALLQLLARTPLWTSMAAATRLIPGLADLRDVLGHLDLAPVDVVVELGEVRSRKVPVVVDAAVHADEVVLGHLLLHLPQCAERTR